MHDLNKEAVNKNVGLIVTTLTGAGCNVQFVQDKFQLEKPMKEREYCVRIGLPHGHNTLAMSIIVLMADLEDDYKSLATLTSVLQQFRMRASKANVLNRLTQAISQCNQ